MSDHTRENCNTPEECALVDAHADDAHERETEPSLEAAKPSPLAQLWGREVDASAERAIRDVAIHGEPAAIGVMAASAIKAGASPSMVERVLQDIIAEHDTEDDDEDADNEQGADVVPILSRQQRRAQERAAEKEQQSLISITRAQFEKLSRARIMLAALVRREGRTRISQRELGLSPGARLDVKVQDNGDLVVTFLEG